MSFTPRSPGVRADELLWTYRHIDEDQGAVTMAGVRLDGISLRRNLISSQARVRGNAIERLARIGYLLALGRRDWSGAGEGRENAVRIGSPSDRGWIARRLQDTE